MRCVVGILRSTSSQLFHEWPDGGDLRANGRITGRRHPIVHAKAGDETCPQPSDLFDFADENVESINDGYLEINPTPGGNFPDIPAADMGLGCGFSYGDGHAAIHKWQTSALILPAPGNAAALEPASKVTEHYAPGGNADWVWFTQHATCPKLNCAGNRKEAEGKPNHLSEFWHGQQE